MIKPRKRNRQWIDYLAPEKVQLNQVTGFLSAGNTAVGQVWMVEKYLMSMNFVFMKKHLTKCVWLII